jgi:hypothetical protein
VLRSGRERLAKLVLPDGTMRGYSAGLFYDLRPQPVRGLDDLETLLCRLITRPDCAVIRGKPIDPARCDNVRRLQYADRDTGYPPTVRDVPRQWVALDMDAVTRPDSVPVADLEACGRLALALLPPSFAAAACIVQATGGHGFKPGARLRLWYWLERPITGAEAKRWLRRVPLDTSVFGAVQPIYTARPVLSAGIADPCPLRLARLPGLAALPVPELSPPATVPTAPASALQTDGAADMLARVLFRLRTASEGQRHYRLRAAAFTLGGLLEAGGISKRQAEEALLDAVRAAGGAAIDDKNASKTIAWGLEHGAAKPLRIEDRL